MDSIHSIDNKQIHVRMHGHDYTYELGDVLGLFYPRNMIRFEKEPFLSEEGFSVFSRLFGTGGELTAHAIISEKGRVISEYRISRLEKEIPGDWNEKKAGKHLVKYSVFEALRKFTLKRQPWGMLTGIRPSKIAYELIEQGYDENRAVTKIKHLYSVEEEKARLIYKVSQVEKEILSKTEPHFISIYIGIPFCPTRCLYCSFTSNPLSKSSCQVEPYLKALFLEIEAVGKLAREKGWKVQSIYIGGGTPTSISGEQLERLLRKVKENFPFSGEAATEIAAETESKAATENEAVKEGKADSLAEMTLEAGRPDTITEDKLQIAKKYGVNRISVNPQTMNAEILKNIGRAHTPEQTMEAFQLARKCGFKNINMDLIAGLPGETPEQFKYTLDRIRELGPDSLTVHTLAIKRASQLKDHLQEYKLANPESVNVMLETAAVFAEQMGMHPYYLYRQKNMIDNLENTGYCRPGCESIYNIQIMEEKQTILAMGADGVSKLVYPKENRIERIFNVKNVEEYIKRIDEMIERKVKELEKI